jgi:hypothetical protein
MPYDGFFLRVQIRWCGADTFFQAVVRVVSLLKEASAAVLFDEETSQLIAGTASMIHSGDDFPRSYVLAVGSQQGMVGVY